MKNAVQEKNRAPALSLRHEAGAALSVRRILVHVCCGPCAVIPLKSALKGSAEVCGFFHNPNIHPYSEFKKRLAAVKTLAKLFSVDMIYDETYAPMRFIKAVHGASPQKYPAKGIRCSYCYSSRLAATAKAAASRGFDAFTSSLLYSRHQKHDEIREIGEAEAQRHGVAFYYENFRRGWDEGIAESKAMGLYRHNYCGCIYSKLESAAKARLAGR